MLAAGGADPGGSILRRIHFPEASMAAGAAGQGEPPPPEAFPGHEEEEATMAAGDG